MLPALLGIGVAGGTAAREATPWTSPPMGWNPCMGTYNGAKYCGGSHPPSESLVLSVADALRDTGLARLGYNTLELDDGWPAPARDNATGDIVADPKLFPNGMADIVARLGAMDPPLYFGLYTDRGTTTCGNKPGSAGHEAQDAATYIKWGIRQVKSDSCAAPGEHRAALAQYKLMQDALDAAPAARPVFFGLCGWWNWYAAAGAKAGVGNSYRVATDCVGYEQMLLNLDAVAGVTSFVRPGRWPDMDMISAADLGTNGLRKPARVQTQFSLIAATGAVLLLSFDVRAARTNRAYIDIVNNSEIVAVHQDPPAGPGYARRLPAVPWRGRWRRCSLAPTAPRAVRGRSGPSKSTRATLGEPPARSSRWRAPGGACRPPPATGRTSAVLPRWH